MDAGDPQLSLFAAPAPTESSKKAEYFPLLGGSFVDPHAASSGSLVIDPYRGCEFGCAACGLRGHGPEGASDRRITVRADAAVALAEDLARPELAGRGLILGAAGDPYQPAERMFRLTRRLLDVIRAAPARPLALFSRSDLIRSDLARLAKLAERQPLSIGIICGSDDEELLHWFEPGAPAPRSRLRALRLLRQRGVRTGLLMGPLLPGLNDAEEALRRLLAQARAADASFVGFGMPDLAEPAHRRLIAWLERRAPELHQRYRAAFGEGERYRRTVDERWARILAEEGFGHAEAGGHFAGPDPAYLRLYGGARRDSAGPGGPRGGRSPH